MTAQYFKFPIGTLHPGAITDRKVKAGLRKRARKLRCELRIVRENESI
jgi:hypothetical protein